MKTKHYSGHYSLEERMVEPFRSIRWISVPKSIRFVGIIGLVCYLAIWWHFKDKVFQFWGQELSYLLRFVDQPWTVHSGVWPSRVVPWISLPKLTAGILPPYQRVWWLITFLTMALWLISDTWKSALLPLKAISRFVVFLVWISLACFAISPALFNHSVEEWSKIFFLGAYGSFAIYGAIWTFGVMWFPISTGVKIFVSLLALCFELVAVPLLLFVSTVILNKSSLLFLPLFALLIAPLTQLGWFVSFYSLALSAGSDPKKEVRLE